MATKITPCGQCGKPAVAETGNGIPLCVDCYSKLQAAIATQQQQIAAMMNYLTGEMEMVVGLPGTFPRLQIPEPPPVIQSGPIAFHNIHVDRSIVGAINTGEVHRIDVSLSSLHNIGNGAAVEALRELTETILVDPGVSDAQRNELIEQIAFLAAQTVAPAKNRKLGLIRSILAGLTDTANTVASISGAWQKQSRSCAPSSECKTVALAVEPYWDPVVREPKLAAQVENDSNLISAQGGLFSCSVNATEGRAASRRRDVTSSIRAAP